MFTWKRLLLAACGLFILLLLAAAIALPGFIIDKAQSWVATETNRRLEIADIRIDPFALVVEINGVRLSEQDHSATFLSWEQLQVAISPQSLFKLAPIVRGLVLVKPYLHLERLPEGRFNFSDLLPPQPPTAEADSAESEPVHFALNNLTVHDGSIDVDDRTLEEPVHHSVRQLELAVPFVGNLPYMVEQPVQPLLAARINDAPVHFSGALKPFTDTQELNARLELTDIDLAHYLSYVPMELPVKLQSGRLNLDLDLTYRLAPQEEPQLSLQGQVNLTSLNIFDRQNEQLFFLPLLQCDVLPTNLLAKDIHLAAVRLYNLEVQVKRDAQGNWNHARMASTGTDPPQPAAAEEKSPPLTLLIDAIQIRDGIVSFEDREPNQEFTTVAHDINIDVHNFSPTAARNMPLSLSLQTDRDETVEVHGDFSLKPLSLQLQTTLQDIDVGAYAPYHEDFYAAPLGGKIDAQINLASTPDNLLSVTESDVTWREFSMAFNDKEGMSIDRLHLQGVGFDWTKKHLEIARYEADQGKSRFSRSRQGTWSFLSGYFPILQKIADSSPRPADRQKASEAHDFSVRIGDMAFTNWQFDIQDNLPSTPVLLTAKNANLSARNLAFPEAVQSPFVLETDFGRRGHINLKGDLSLVNQTIALQGQVKDIALATFAPYIAEEINIDLVSGFLNANLKTELLAANPLDMRFGGQLGIRKMHILDGTNKEDLLKWDSLQVAGIKGGFAPLQLAIDSVTLSDYFAKVLIDEEVNVNLVQAFARKSAEEVQKSPGPVEQEEALGVPTTATASPGQADLKIDKVVLQGGRIDFSDRHLPRPFHADMTELGGSIDGLSSDPDRQATVDLRGSLRDQSPLNISGTVNPLAEQLQLDVRIDFNDIEMSPFSPYSSKYVGYLIEKGKLNLALNYVIENHQLKASNSVFLDQFNFGESVDSPDAINLPVKLAVALLKDGNGEIHLDIPVYGDLANPQFSVPGVIWTVIKNLLVKAATSPFALLGALVGGGDEDFSTVNFDLGSAQLKPEEQEKLTRMAKALLERPGIDVEVSGYIDAENDPEGYRKEQLAQQIRRLKYRDMLDSGTLPADAGEQGIKVGPEDYDAYLWDVYQDADFPKPRNFLGITKKLPASEMEKLIYANTPVTDQDLANLARDRAQAVQSFLVETGSLAPGRIFLKEPDITAPPDEATAQRARVELGASVP
ncbi:MAG: DUF748 domain-containing protein [Desulfuromonadales bacterium]